MAEIPRPRDLHSTVAAKRDREQRAIENGNGSNAPRYGPFAWPARIVLLAAILALPWAFGGVYYGTQFFVSAAMVVALVFWWLDLAFTLRRVDLTPWIILPLTAGLLLGIAQLIPLGDNAAAFFAPLQHKLYTDVASISENAWGPTFTISIDREATWHQVRLLALALAGVLLGAGLFHRKQDLMTLLVAVTINGVLLTAFGFIQSLSWNGKVYWVHELVNGGLVFGPFINRNNASGYLLMCLAAAIGAMVYLWNVYRYVGPQPIVSKEIPIWRQWQEHLATQIAELTTSKLLLVLACGFIGAGVIGTVSRGGVIALLVSGIAYLLIYGMARRPKTGGLLFIPVLALIVLLGSWIGFFDELTRRFGTADIDAIASGEFENDRVQSWSQSLQSTSQSGILGAGLGAYPSINRQFAEQRESALAEFAENQFVQSLVDGGIPALVLVLFAVILAGYSATFLLFRGSSPLSLAAGATGVFLICSQVTAGCFDFGWYVPANMVLGAVLVGALSFHSHFLASRLKKRTVLSFVLPNWFGRSLALCAFAVTVIVAISFYREAVFDAVRGPDPLRSDYASLDLAATDSLIAELADGEYPIRTSRAFNHVGLLFVHRARLANFESLCATVPVQTLNEDRRRKVLDNFWNVTNLIRIQEQLHEARNSAGIAGVTNFRAQPYMRDLAMASEYLLRSWRLKPTQAEVAARLGQIQYLLGSERAAARFTEKAVELAPTNIRLRSVAGLTNLYRNDPGAAAKHFRRILELDGEEFAKTITLFRDFMRQTSGTYDNRMIAEQIIPDDPRMIYNFVVDYLAADDPLRTELLDRADNLLTDFSLSDHDTVLLKANVRLANGDWQGGLEFLESAVVSNPYDQPNRYRLAALMLEHGNLEGARQHAENLLSINSKHAPYVELMQKIKNLQNKRDEVPESN